RVAAHDCHVVVVSTYEHMGGAGVPQPPDQPDLIVHLGPVGVDEDRLKPSHLGSEAKALHQFATIDRAVIDYGKQLVSPSRHQYVGDRLLLCVGARSRRRSPTYW